MKKSKLKILNTKQWSYDMVDRYLFYDFDINSLERFWQNMFADGPGDGHVTAIDLLCSSTKHSWKEKMEYSLHNSTNFLSITNLTGLGQHLHVLCRMFQDFNNNIIFQNE